MIFRSPIFRKLLTGALLLVAVTLLTLNFFLTRYTAQHPIENIGALTAGIHKWILLTSLVSASLALMMAYFFSRSFAKRISRLGSFAEGLLNARSPDVSLPEGAGELGVLASSLNRTAVELRRLIEKLSLESARREAILASMVEGVLAVDHELRITFCNASFARAAGVSGLVPEHLPLLELVRDPGLLELLTQVIVTGESARQRLQLSGTEGRSFEVQVAPLAAHSSRGAIAILHDVTDLERLERVRRDFVANVSHELRTPLTAIRGYAETLLEGALEDQENNRKFLEIIKAHSIRLNNIASDLLTLSELESRPSIQAEQISVRAAVETALRTVEPEARLRQVRVTCVELEELAVVSEKGRLEQALLNLLDNAVKFNRPRGEVKVEATRAPGGRIRIVVSDTGIGIPSEELPRVFERFYRVDKARSREVGGTGLGLSIVRHIIERMNGSITVESELGKGSSFTVFLPSA